MLDKLSDCSKGRRGCPLFSERQDESLVPAEREGIHLGLTTLDRTSCDKLVRIYSASHF